MSNTIEFEAIRRAEQAIDGKLLRTPSVKSPGLEEHLGVPVALKLETLQLAGCFKPRGVVNKVHSLSEEQRAKGLVAVSGGNHGLAVATIAASMGLDAAIVMPETAPQSTQKRILATGAELVLTADVASAIRTAESNQYRKLTYIHPFDDALMIAGHGTLGLELVADVPELTDVLVSIGGGGLISGVATAVKTLQPDVRIWGVEVEGADAMSRALAAGHPVDVDVTSIASTLGAPYVTELTFMHVKALVEDVLVVSDREAIEGVLTLAEKAKLWAEPAAGCLIPAARRVVECTEGRIVLGLIVCGGNVSFAEMAQWVERFGLEHQRLRRSRPD